MIRIPGWREHQKVRKQTLLKLLLQLWRMRNLSYSVASSSVQASVLASFNTIWHHKRNVWEAGNALKVGMMVMKSSGIHSHYCTGRWTPNISQWFQWRFLTEETPWKADPSLSELVENLPVTLASFAYKTIIFHYKRGWICLHLVSRYLKTTPSDQAPNIWFLKNSSFSSSLF